MGELSDLERRIQRLEDIEAIKKLKINYWNSVDNKLWEELADCFAEESVLEVPLLPRYEGRDAIVGFIKESMEDATSAHQGHNADIEITGDATAKGKWALNDYVEFPGNAFFKGYGHYEEEYVRVNGRWTIGSLKLSYVVTETWTKGPSETL